ncbi:hypothetical protein [Nocardia transvalensis]|uniref:hypothetical protein n=1 Tax=Nocardia transvalensis TaxID=37333 RepID=UPI001895ED34|nr:hypothetical protein [Nocardia transvalensis]MBF6333498.1 hypothetical protein [Nocardia transvalensis]
MLLHTRSCVLGPIRVGLATNDDRIVAALREFYALSDRVPGLGDWMVDAIVDTPDPAVMTVNRWGVGHRCDPDRRLVQLVGENVHTVAVAARKTLREVLIDHLEQRRYVMLHASAVADNDRVVIIVGDKGAGKTTLALKSVVHHGMRYLSNDHLIVYAEPGSDPERPRLVLTSLPTPIPVRVGTYLDLEPLLPPPWDGNGVALDRWRTTSVDHRHRSEAKVYLTYPQLSQANPITLRLGDLDAATPSVFVALAGYTCGRPVLTAIAEPVAALLPHVRTDWMFDPILNQHCIARTERNRVAYEQDARRLVTALAARSAVLGWHHHGDPNALVGRTIVKGGDR